MDNNKPHLLFYTHHYYPDAAAIGQLIQELTDALITRNRITIICAVPSYTGKVPAEYKPQKYYREWINGAEVLRVAVPECDKTKKLSRIRNVMAYFFRAMKATLEAKKVSCVFAVSQPPILGGLLGVWGKWIHRAKLIYNIQDFNPEQIIVTGYSKNRILHGVLMMLDKFSCRQADQVIVVGRDMVGTLKKRFAGKNGAPGRSMPEYSVINNWVDETKVYPLQFSHPKVAAFRERYALAKKYVIMYSGNLGLYYDLENVIKVIEKFPKGTTASDGREVMFAFVGAGALKVRLREYCDSRQMQNVAFIPYQDKEDIVYSLNAADVHWCVSAKGIKGISTPSKIYGILAVGKPVLGVLEKGSEACFILEEAQCGLVSEPENYEEIEKHIRWMINHASSHEAVKMGERGRNYLKTYLTKDISIRKYIESINEW